MSAIHVVMPDSVADPARPSGGNAYDRRVCDGLAARGRIVVEHAVPGNWPDGDVTALAAMLAAVPDGAVALVDGLIASAAPDVCVPASRRLRLAVLVHMPLGFNPGSDGGTARADHERGDRERAVLRSAGVVIATSGWTRDWLAHAYGIERVRVARPGADPAPLSTSAPAGDRLLCVGAITRLKGHDVLIDALARLRAARPDLAWRCAVIGSTAREPQLAETLAAQAVRDGLTERVDWLGVVGGAGIARAYASSDLLVLPSRAETYGMVVTEALARGLPVVASDVGGVREALRGDGAVTPGILAPTGDPDALARALGTWLTEAGTRRRLRESARARRATLSGWTETVEQVEAALYSMVGAAA